MKRGTSGFTVLETVSSAAILSLLVFAALGASRVAMRGTGSVVSVDAADSRVAESLTRMRRLLMPASVSSLEAVPSPYGVAPEPMQDGVVYDNMSFRTVTGYANGGPVYVPALGTNPWQLFFRAGQNGAGELVLDDGRSVTTLLENVRGAAFVLQGKQLAITLQTARPDYEGDATAELRLVLLVP
jgi:hypothetical protein